MLCFPPRYFVWKPLEDFDGLDIDVFTNVNKDLYGLSYKSKFISHRMFLMRGLSHLFMPMTVRSNSFFFIRLFNRIWRIPSAHLSWIVSYQTGLVYHCFLCISSIGRDLEIGRVIRVVSQLSRFCWRICVPTRITRAGSAAWWYGGQYKGGSNFLPGLPTLMMARI